MTPRVPTLRATLAAALLLATAGCTSMPNPPPLRSLRGMSDASLLCLATLDSEADDAVPTRYSRPLDACPDFNSNDGESRSLHSLLTQPETGEVALVDLQRARVVDAEVALPGLSFLPVGAEPFSIVSTPGGAASFVATVEAGRPGIYALPTSCVATRREDQAFVDVTSWAACRLPAAPGAMQVLIDSSFRSSCDDAPNSALGLSGSSPGAQRVDCPADLSAELGPLGQRKLLVALPSLGELVLIDAQAILDRPPGSFDDCSIERTVPLQVLLPSVPLQQRLPNDLPSRPLSCVPSGASYQLPQTGYLPTPVDFAQDGDTLYVADSSAPVVHVLDTRDPCATGELPPLLPQSYSEPGALVTTRRVAVSPRTSKGQNFLYAIEESTAPTAGSVMVFDVSLGSSERTPLVRPQSQRIAQEPPDRIQYSQEAADVEFVERQVAALDPITGVSVEQVACDPRIIDSTAPAAQFQPNADLTAGAAPARLHGVFAFIALHSGQVAVVDVDDLDAACRRPVSVNPTSALDFHGCAEDPNVDFGNPRTVSDEISCNVVQPHRARSSTFFVNDTHGRSAALRQFPRLTSSTGRPLPTDQTEPGKQNPMLLAVDFSANEPAQVFVGSALYQRGGDAASELVVDPARADRSSVALSLVEPRQFYPNDQLSLTYEGSLGAKASTKLDTQGAQARLDAGVGGHFCSMGVQDVAATRDFAQQFFPAGAAAADVDAFVASHADYIQLQSDFPAQDSAYWQSSAGLTCGAAVAESEGEVSALTGRRFCELWFGTIEAPTARRDLRVSEAYQNTLWVEPRLGGHSPEVLTQLVGCCFPEITDYTLRAGQQWILRSSSRGFQHSIAVDPGDGRCVPSCDPALQGRSSRAVEISCADDCPTADDDLPIIGLASNGGEFGQDHACVVADPRGGVGPGTAGSECVFQQGPTRFAIYRGRTASVRDMQFSWQMRGGFVPMSIGISTGANSLPEQLRFIPKLQTVMVVDGGTAGLGLIGVGSLFNRPIY